MFRTVSFSLMNVSLFEYLSVPLDGFFFLKFKSFNMKLIFWMQVIIFKLSENHSFLIQNGLQEPKTDQDETYSQKVNEYQNNPPTPGSQQDLQSLLSSMSRQQLIKLFGNVGEVSCLSSLLIPSDGFQI